MQQPGQMRGISGVGLDSIPRRSLQLRRCRHPAINTRTDQRPRQPESRRARLIGHRHRRWQISQPFPDLPVIWSQPALEYLTGVPIKSTSDYRTCVHIQTDARTLNLHWGLLQPHILWLYRPGPDSRRQPTLTCARRPQPPIRSSVALTRLGPRVSAPTVRRFPDATELP